MTDDEKLIEQLSSWDAVTAHRAADRIEQLETKLALMIFERDEAWKRAAHSEKMWGEAEAKLAKAVEAIKQSIKEWESPHYGDEDIKIDNGATGFYLLRTVLAELEGK